MLAWLSQNAASIIICAILIAVVVLIIVYMRRCKKKGKSSCGCTSGCGECPMSGSCHKK